MIEEPRTFHEAKKERKEDINQLRKGDQQDRCLADLLARCRKDNRCNLTECAVCEFRKTRALRRVSRAVETMTIIGERNVRIDVDSVQVVGSRRPLNEAKVRRIAASMRVTGLQTPITIRAVKK